DVTLSYLRGGPLRQRYEDVLGELRYEIKSILSHRRLAQIDQELHNVYITPSESVETRVLLNRPQLFLKRAAIVQLTAEVHRIVVRHVVERMLYDVLDSMKEAWVFGETTSMTTVSGFVPTWGSSPVS